MTKKQKITVEEKAHIEQIVTNVKKRLGICGLFNISRILRDEGFNICTLKPNTLKGRGCLLTNTEKAQRDIFINYPDNLMPAKDEVRGYSRYVVAMCYGYALLSNKVKQEPNTNGTLKYYGFHIFSIDKPTKDDIKAEYFARCLLMPENEFTVVYKYTKSIGKLCTLFEVSREAVSERINDLHLD